MRISVVGAGAFGTAVAIAAARSGNEVLLWAHDPRVAASLAEKRENAVYLPGFPLPDEIAITNSLAEAAKFSDTLFMIVPSHHYRGVLTQLGDTIEEPVRVVSGTKGIENDSLERMSQISAAVLGRRLRAFAALSGPTFAVELAKADPTAAVIASADADFATHLQHVLSSPTFRLYSSPDVSGVELAGAFKNVIAIAAGVLEGLGLGFNTNAALVTRGLHEMTKLGIAMGGRPETFAGLAGMGDLVLTCTGSLSRNRKLGAALGQGKRLPDILAETRTVAEGVKTALSLRDLSEKLRIEMPIASEMYRVLYEEESPRGAIQRLMMRALKSEAAL
jgi:glycerol-3-phosphate dehydrogenase (NAD(P)+)